MLLNPEEVLKALKQQVGEASPTMNQSKLGFIRIPNLSFGGKERLLRNPELKDGKDLEGKTPRTGQAIASFFRGKSSFFSRNSPKGCVSPPKGSVSRSEFSWVVI